MKLHLCWVHFWTSRKMMLAFSLIVQSSFSMQKRKRSFCILCIMNPFQDTKWWKSSGNDRNHQNDRNRRNDYMIQNDSRWEEKKVFICYVLKLLWTSYTGRGLNYVTNFKLQMIIHMLHFLNIVMLFDYLIY